MLVDGLAPEVRVVTVVPMRMVIIDDTVLTPVKRDEPSLGAYVYSGSLADVAQALFTSLWEQGVPLLERATHSFLTPREKQICQLLIRGGTDEQMARPLRLSARTVRKVVGDVGTKLDAPSRSALSYELGVRGLL